MNETVRTAVNEILQMFDCKPNGIHLLFQRVINQLKYYHNDKAKGNDRVQSLIVNECVDQDDQQEVNIVELAELGEKDDWQVGT